MKTRSLMLLVASVSALTVTSCSGGGSEVDGDPTVAPSPARDVLPSHGAPKVNNPVDATAFETKPCDVVPMAALAKAGIKVEAPDAEPDDSTGPICDWKFRRGPDGGRQGTMGTRINTLSDRGLSDIYDQRGTSFQLFEELPPIEGYPAVIHDTSDSRSEGICNLSVGISDQQTYDVQTDLDTAHPQYSDSCSVAVKVATIALQTLTK